MQAEDDDVFEEPIDSEELFDKDKKNAAVIQEAEIVKKLDFLTLETKTVQYKSHSPVKKKDPHNSTKSEACDAAQLHSNDSAKTNLTISPGKFMKQIPIIKKKLVMARTYFQMELERKTYSEFKYTFKCDEFNTPKCEIMVAKMSSTKGHIALGCKNGSIYIYQVKDESDGKHLIRWLRKTI